MKITNVIHPVDPNLSVKTGKVTLASPNSAAASSKPTGRFDTFTLVGTSKPDEAKKLSFDKAELIRNLENLSEEEKANVAVGSYIDMQKCCKSAISHYETDIYSFKSLQEEKAYYNKLKNQGGTVSEEGGKYAFTAASAGSTIDEKEIDAALSEVQERINRFIMAPTEETARYELTDKIFRSASQAFSTVAGISDDALNLEDDSLCKVREGLTEENFLEKENEAINSIRERSEQLSKVMGDYMEKNPYVKEKMKDINNLLRNDHSEKTNKLIEVLEKYGDEINSLPFKLNLFYNPFPDQFGEDYTMKIPQE